MAIVKRSRDELLDDYIAHGARRSSRPREPDKCVFCGADKPLLTSEHVFSRWTHKYLAPRAKGKAKSIRGIEHQDPSKSYTEVIKLAGQLRDWKIKCVCGGDHTTCNGGWMKSMEDIAIPILKPLILGTYTDEDRHRISLDDQSIIAAWATLKVMVAEFDKGSQPITHHMQRKYMMNHKLTPPHKWGVWIGHFNREKWITEWGSHPFQLLPDRLASRRPDREVTYFNGNSTTQVVNKLFIHVIHSPMPNLVERWRFALPNGGTLFRVWPPTGHSILWPGTPLDDRDADVAADAFTQRLREINAEVTAMQAASKPLS